METTQITQETIKKAKEELEAVCTKHGITLLPVVVHQGNQTFSSIEIIPAPTENADIVAAQ